MSVLAERTVNPIRGVVEKIDKSGNPDKNMIDLALGMRDGSGRLRSLMSYLLRITTLR